MKSIEGSVLLLESANDHAGGRCCATLVGVPPPGWAVTTAVICRKMKRYGLEVEVLERYRAHAPEGDDGEWVLHVWP